MFDEINGIPAHPLLVHFAVVFVVLMVVGAVVYAVVPPLRKTIGWAVVLLAIAGPGAAWFAKEAGESLKRARPWGAETLVAIDEHQRFGNLTEYFSLGLAAAVLVLVGVSVAVGRAAATGVAESQPAPERNIGALVVSIGLSVVVLVLAAFTAYYAYKAGDSGARMVWT